MEDPRTENCRRLVVDADGKITGVELVYQAHPDSKYRLVKVELIDERTAQGNTVATCIVQDRDGIAAADPVYLAWPWPALSQKALPGNPHGQHFIGNAYNPPDLGPLALYVGGPDGNPDSDIVGGLGLPGGHHVSYTAVWRERNAEQEPEPEPDAATALERIAAALERLVAHLGA